MGTQADRNSPPAGQQRSGFVARLKALIGELGPMTALLYLVNATLGRSVESGIVFRYRLVAQPVAGPSPTDKRMLRGQGVDYDIRLIEPDEPLIADLGLPEAVVADRFGQGGECLGLIEDGHLIGAVWTILGPFNEDEVACTYQPLPAGETAWDFGVHVDPAHRHSMAFARLWCATNQRLRDRGIRWTLSRISAFNPPSLAAHERLGAKRLGTATFIRVGKLQLMWASVAPYLHLTFRGRGPLLRLDARHPRA